MSADTATFWQWLQHQAARHDCVGDLARDAIADETWPRRARTAKGIDLYLESCGADDATRAAVAQAIAEWKL